MIHLSNIANSVLERSLAPARGGLLPTEFGSRFQLLVAAVLKSLPDHEDLYVNPAGGQPDCYSMKSGAGFEVKCLARPRIELEPNSWDALRTYPSPRLVALLTTSAPFPLWVVDLKDHARHAITLERSMPVDAERERRIKPSLDRLIEAIGAERFCAGDRETFSNLVSRIAAALLQ
jgi:hypothetical protein